MIKRDESRGSPFGKAYSTRSSEGQMSICFPSRGSRVRVPFPAPDLANQGVSTFGRGPHPVV